MSTETRAADWVPPPPLKVGDKLTAPYDYLFGRTAWNVAKMARELPPHLEATRPVVTHAWDYAAGEVFSVSEPRVPGVRAHLWYGVVTAPSRIVRVAMPRNDDAVYWGADLSVQFLEQSHAGEWEFFFPPAGEAVIDGKWWQRFHGLSLDTDVVSLHAAVTEAMRNLSARHGREGQSALRTAGLVMRPSPAGLAIDPNTVGSL